MSCLWLCTSLKIQDVKIGSVFSTKVKKIPCCFHTFLGFFFSLFLAVMGINLLIYVE